MNMRIRPFLMSATLTVVLALTSGIARAQDAQSCQPGIAGAYFGPHAAQYQAIVNAMVPVFGQLTAELNAMVDQSTYQALLDTANTLAGALATGRVVVTVSDGTVVLDTSRDDNTVDPKSNSYQHFLDKTINENHNSRIAIFSAQAYPCGIGVESKFSTTTLKTESYVAIRVGPGLDSAGTVRMSVQE